MIMDTGASGDYIFIVDQEGTQNYVAAIHDDKEEIVIVVDSGAAASCVNKDLLPEVTVQRGKQKYNLKAAHGTKLSTMATKTSVLLCFE